MSPSKAGQGEEREAYIRYSLYVEYDCRAVRTEHHRVVLKVPEVNQYQGGLQKECEEGQFLGHMSLADASHSHNVYLCTSRTICVPCPNKEKQCR